jgi:hypothetical protein
VDQTITICMAILRTLKENLVMAQNRMQHQADQGHSEHESTKGDHVFLHLQPYKNTSLKYQHYYKFTPKLYGPYRIIKRVGPVAYQLEFHSQSKLHPGFHVSFLKKVLGTRFHT